MPYEYKKSNDHMWMCLDEPKLDFPDSLCCDECDEKCKLSLDLQIEDKKYKPRSGTQYFVIKPIMRVGDKKLPKVALLPSVKQYPNEIVVRFFCGNAKWYYQQALLLCRKTCRYSRLR